MTSSTSLNMTGMDLNTTSSFCNLEVTNDTWTQPYDCAYTVCRDIGLACQADKGNLTLVGTTGSNSSDGFNVYGFYSPSYEAAMDCATKIAPNATLDYTTSEDYQKIQEEKKGDSSDGIKNVKIAFGLSALLGVGILLQLI